MAPRVLNPTPAIYEMDSSLIRERVNVRQAAPPDVTCNRSNRFRPGCYCVTTTTPCAAFVMTVATACGCDT